MKQARVYHSFRSPYSRLGLHVLKRAQQAAAIIPFTGPPEGVAFQDPAQNPLKLAYFRQDAMRMTARMGLPMRAPDSFDVDMTAANRALVAAGRDGCGLDFAIAVSDARWGRGENVGEIATLRRAAAECGWRTDAVDAAQHDPDVTAQLQAHRQLIAADGVFGVPFAVCGAQKFWGHDRFDLFLEALAGAD